MMKPADNFIQTILVFTVAFGTLCTELLATKVLSFVYWNHVVYLIISLALLGYGMSSTFIIMLRNRIGKIPLTLFLCANLLLFAVSILTALFYLSMRDTTFFPSVISLLISYFLFLFPFFFSGNILVYIFYINPAQSNRLYFWDLVGAALGCLLFIPLINTAGAIGGILLIIISLLSVSIYILISDRSLSTKTGKLIFILSLLITVSVAWALPDRDSIFYMHPDKSKSLGHALDKNINPAARHEYTMWDVVTRVDVASTESKGLNIGWTTIKPDTKLITFDGDAISQISLNTKAFPILADIKRFQESDLHAPFFEQVGKGDHLIIGLGGGPDIERSLLMEARSITGVDINSAIIQTMKYRYADYSGNIFNRPNVTLFHSEGRSFLKNSSRHYDLIQMTGVDTFTALNSGAYVLAENYLYTVNAMRDYYRSLSENGILCIHRWFYDAKPRESLRLFAIALEALRQEGVEHPETHLAVIRAGSGITFVKKSPFHESDAKKILASLVGRDGNPKIIYLPGVRPDNHPAAKFYRSLVNSFKAGTLEQFYENYEYDITPVSDDQPFFFNYYKLKRLFELPLSSILNTGPIQGYWAYMVFLLILTSASLAVCIFIFIPLFIFRRDGMKTHGSAYASVYFLSLGLGFIMVEITLMQKLALFLGHPMYSIASVIGGMLLFAGIGSHVSARYTNRPIKALFYASVIATVTTLWFLGPADVVMSELMGKSLLVRVITTICMIAPMSLSLGFFFPLGLNIVQKAAPEFIPWAWGINSGFTVIGSIIAIICAMSSGFSIVLIIAMLIYWTGLLAIWKYVAIRGMFGD